MGGPRFAEALGILFEDLKALHDFDWRLTAVDRIDISALSSEGPERQTDADDRHIALRPGFGLDFLVVRSLANLQYRQEGFLGDLHPAHALHTALALFLFVE